MNKCPSLQHPPPTCAALRDRFTVYVNKDGEVRVGEVLRKEMAWVMLATCALGLGS